MGSSPAFYFFIFNLLVCSSLILILSTQGYIFLNLGYVYSTNTHVETWIISISRNVITLCTQGEFSTFVVICWPISKWTFSKASFRNTIRVSNSPFSDQGRRSVGTDLGTNCLQRLSTDSKGRRWQEKNEENLEIMNIKATKYKSKMESSPRDDVKYKNNLNLKNKRCNLTIIYKKRLFQVSIQVGLICKLPPNH